MGEGMKEWLDGCMGKWMDVWVNEWINEWTDEWMNRWMNGWTDESMNDWMNAWTNEAIPLFNGNSVVIWKTFEKMEEELYMRTIFEYFQQEIFKPYLYWSTVVSIHQLSSFEFTSTVLKQQ